MVFPCVNTANKIVWPCRWYIWCPPYYPLCSLLTEKRSKHITCARVISSVICYWQQWTLQVCSYKIIISADWSNVAIIKYTSREEHIIYSGIVIVLLQFPLLVLSSTWTHPAWIHTKDLTHFLAHFWLMDLCCYFRLVLLYVDTILLKHFRLSC